MVDENNLRLIWSNVAQFLNQNDLTSLARTSKFFAYEICDPQLYQNIVISRDPVLRSDKTFLDTNNSYISGYRSLKKTGDQNDLFLHDRIHRLVNSSQLGLVKTLIIQEDNFVYQEDGQPILKELIEQLIELGQIETLEIRDKDLFEHYYQSLKELPKLKRFVATKIEDLNSLRCLKNLKSLELLLNAPDFEHGCLSEEVKLALTHNIEELVIDDMEFSSLRLFQYFESEKIKLNAVQALKFNHVHGIHDYNKTMRELTTVFFKNVFKLENIVKLEMELSCEESGCSCIDDFLLDLAPKVTSLRDLGLIEKTFITQGNHYTEENWDLAINRFILNLPNVSEQLRTLAIRHNPPLNGLTEDSVEGNYIRRRTIYENVLPKLCNLQTLIAPSFLQSVAAYEILVCDLLWNGCECSFCEKVLDVFDKFIMNHQYYSFAEGEFKDIIPTVFFAYCGDAIARRFITEIDWDLKALSTCPVTHVWDLHGYEYVQHFEDYDCHYDQSAFVHLVKCVSHFFNSYMDCLVKFLPSLKFCIISGVYYTIDDKGNYECIYD
ncbi:LAFE_0E05490g1_1 [Lachancea fermentati]|uniref:LAFE_0E05490g1_1 n=1 Tax=Lachancea fermentati TaxID=4955 RepID=A0A1G4MCV4_LACFM|nr:LAFE_0E05490g1_1 [Lachancea fermentati]